VGLGGRSTLYERRPYYKFQSSFGSRINNFTELNTLWMLTRIAAEKEGNNIQILDVSKLIMD